MKIRIIEKSYREVADIQPPKHKKPMKQSLFFRLLLRVASAPDLWATHFRLKKVGMERLGKHEPCLYLMNHSSFLDLEIASVILFPRRFSIVSTTDGFVGKNLLMRLLGCIPTKKFVTDLTLVKDMIYAVRTLKSSVLLFPEAGYSLDGRTTRLPDSLGQFVKMLGKSDVRFTNDFRDVPQDNWAYEYVMYEEIVCICEYTEFNTERVKALLKSPTPLEDIFARGL